MNPWHETRTPDQPAHPQLPVEQLNAWNLGQEACDCGGVYSDPQLLGHRDGDQPLRYGHYLCRVVHENELRYGTFLGYYTQPSCRLQSWGHFRSHQTAWQVAAYHGPTLTRRPTDVLPPGTNGRLPALAGDLTFDQLTRKSRLLAWPDTHGDDYSHLGGDLILIDHSANYGGVETTLWYANDTYRANLPHHDRTLVTRISLDPTTPMRYAPAPEDGASSW